MTDQMTNALSIFLDERGIDGDSYYFLGGVVLDTSQVSEMADLVRNFKGRLRPEIDPNEWYLKGSGDWVYRGSKNSESKEGAFQRWELWAEHAEKIRTRYTIHATLVLPQKFFARAENKHIGSKERRITVLKAGMLATLLNLDLHKPTDISVWMDRVEGVQAQALDWGKKPRKSWPETWPDLFDPRGKPSRKE